MSFSAANSFSHSSYDIYDTFDVNFLTSPEAALQIPSDEAAINAHFQSNGAFIPGPAAGSVEQFQMLALDPSPCTAVAGQNFLVNAQPPERNYQYDHVISLTNIQPCDVAEESGNDDTEQVAEDVGRNDLLPEIESDYGRRQSSGRVMTRRERRREQNRRAAQRCRVRRKMREAAILREIEKAVVTMQCLESELQRLMSQKRDLEGKLTQHGVYGTRTYHSFLHRNDTVGSAATSFVSSAPEMFSAHIGADTYCSSVR